MGKSAGAYLDRDRHPSFVDLKALANVLADDLRTAAGTAADGEAFLANREALWSSGAASAVGLLRLAGNGRVAVMPADELAIVIQGEVSVETDGETTILGPGDSAVLTKGAAFDWRTGAEALVVYMRFLESRDGEATVVPIGRAPQFAPSALPPQELLLTAPPFCESHVDYTAGNGQFRCGSWRSTPCRRKGFRYPHHEIMHILEGEVTLEDEFGVVQTFTRGAMILAERGSFCAWDNPVDTVKTFAIYRTEPLPH